MKRACDIAQASEFINEKPDGFETEISSGGTKMCIRDSGITERYQSINAPDGYTINDLLNKLFQILYPHCLFKDIVKPYNISF